MKRSTGATLAAVALAAAPASGATFHCVASTDPACQVTHATISAAVTAASADDVVLVGPGTFDETVFVTKKLRFLGAKAGVDARGRAATGESVVNATATGSQNATFFVTAQEVVIDGFTIQGATDGAANGCGVDLKGGASPAHGAQVRNNIIRGNAVGLCMNFEQATPVRDVVIERNLFRDNLSLDGAFGDGIFTSACQNVTIARNRFLGHITAAIGINTSVDVTITGNESAGGDDTFVIFTNTLDSRFRDNRGQGFVNAGQAFGGAQAAVAIGPGNDDIEITNNVLSGGDGDGIAFTSAFGPGTSTDITVAYNTVARMDGDGIIVGQGRLTGGSIIGNTSAGHGGDGIHVGEGNQNLFIGHNTTSRRGLRNTGTDCVDGSTGSGTAGTANTWFKNHGTSSSPPGLCN
jgi:hypothetical protein